MPAKLRKSYRLDETTVSRLDALARLWGGPVKPLDQTAVIDEMARRCIEQEQAPGPQKKNPKKSRQAS